MKSMTGYGTSEGKVGKGRLFVEIKSINHRFSEVNIKMPGKMSALESNIRNFLQGSFIRGKIDVFIKEKSPVFGGSVISVDLDMAKKYKKALDDLNRKLSLPKQQNFLEVVGLDRLLKVEEETGSYQKVWPELARLVERAASGVKKMRESEGRHITQDQTLRLKKLGKLVAAIKAEARRSVEGHVRRMKKRVNVIHNGVDEQRLAVEAACIGGRQDIEEELVRLESHLKQYHNLMKETDSVGRKLDFLLQEMNREANTIGSKAADAGISQMTVECKTELERLREQIQNIE